MFLYFFFLVLITMKEGLVKRSVLTRLVFSLAAIQAFQEDGRFWFCLAFLKLIGMILT
jgi:hypothetical protein